MSLLNNPQFLRKVNGWLTLIWFVAAVPICLFLANSVPFLVFISVYAVVTGHLASWQSGRVESVQDDDANVEDVLAEVKKVRALLEKD